MKRIRTTHVVIIKKQLVIYRLFGHQYILFRIKITANSIKEYNIFCK